MLVKNSNKKIKYFGFIVLIIFTVSLFIFRDKFISFYLPLHAKFFLIETTAISLTEKEEILTLRKSVKILEDELKTLKEEYSLVEDGTKPTFLKMLGLKSDIYGNFYTTYPAGKTVYKGMNVLVGGNIVVGQVDEIFGDGYMKISRLGNSESFIAKGLENDESLEVRSIGSGYYVASVTGSSKFSVGDTIVMSGYPKVIVGDIVEVIKNQALLTQVYIRTPFSIANKEIFYVLQ